MKTIKSAGPSIPLDKLLDKSANSDEEYNECRTICTLLGKVTPSGSLAI